MTVPEPGRRWKKNKVYNPVETPEQQQFLEIATAGVNQGGGRSSSPLMFGSIRECMEALVRAETLFLKPCSECTTPASDETFPQTDEQMKALVGKVFAAIMDWGSYIEWMQVVPRHIKEARSNELVAKIDQHEAQRKRGAPVTDYALEVRDLMAPVEMRRAHMADLEQQQREVLGRPCNAFSASCLAWKLVAAAMQAQQGRSGSTAWTTNDGA